MKARLAASIALAAALLVATSACTLISTNGTLKPYQASDGAGANLGDVKVRNVIGLSADGADVALVFSIVNDSDTDETVTLQFEDASGTKQNARFQVDAGETLAVGHSADDQLVLRDADATVGSLFDVHFSTTEGQVAKTIKVPVLDGTQLEYSDLLPGPAPKPSPSGVPSPSAVPAVEG